MSVLVINGRRSYSPGSTYNNNTGRWTISSIETYWSCPYHDMDANYTEECQECGREPEIECLDCLAADYRIAYDEDGWATLSISSKFLDPNLETWRA